MAAGLVGVDGNVAGTDDPCAAVVVVAADAVGDVVVVVAAVALVIWTLVEVGATTGLTVVGVVVADVVVAAFADVVVVATTDFVSARIGPAEPFDDGARTIDAINNPPQTMSGRTVRRWLT